MRKMLVAILLLTFVGTYSNAETLNNDFKIPEEHMIRSQIFLNVEESIEEKNVNLKAIEQDSIGTFSVSPGVGAVDIQDWLSNSAGWISADQKSGSYNTIKMGSMAILTKALGPVFATVSTVVDYVKAGYEDLYVVMDMTKLTTVTTQYSVRDFYHRLYVYDNNKSWKDVGYSISRYYYTWSAVNFVKKDGNADYAIYFDDDNPSDIDEAKNYKNYSTLAQKAIAAWKGNYRYVETY